MSMESEVHLNGLSVLIDGYNLELKRGTGIRTYGVTLIEALKLLGAHVSVLFSRDIASSDKIPNEILFFDIEKKSFTRLNEIKALFKVACGIRSKAKVVTNHNIVIKRGLDGGVANEVGIITLGGCYSTANTVFRILGFPTNIVLPQKADIWHATHPLPIRVKKAKKITTIHDLVPLKLPYTTLDNKRLFFKIVRNSLADSSIVLTPSENTKSDILNIFDVNPDKIFVTHQPVKIKPVGDDKDKIAVFLEKKYNLECHNYILFVGAIEPKKNLRRLIDAYLMLDTHMPLVIVGKKGWLWEDEIYRVTSNGGFSEKSNIKFIEYIPAKDLRYLYAGAFCFVFPSLYEGFGLPALEAMICGCPVITSNVSSLPEICGNAALYVDPYDTDDIKEKMENLIERPWLRAEYSRTGKERAKLFGMENYVKKIYKAYSMVL